MITRKGKAQQNSEKDNKKEHNKGKSRKCSHISCNFDPTKNNC